MVLGALVLKETHDLTDYEAVDQLSFNIQWHYALNITEESDSAKYMCPKTLWNMRMIVAENRLEKILFNAGTLKLAEAFTVQSMRTFKLLQRILDEQCTVSLSDEGVEISVKEAKQIPSDSLQNPSDPEAGYSGHKGQGYQVQIMETYTDTGDIGQKAETLNLITHVDVESAHESDANALLPAIDSAQEKDLGPKEVLADSLYGSDDNVQDTESIGIARPLT